MTLLKEQTISTELTVQDEAVAALMAQQEKEMGEVRLQVPILKVTQSLTDEVKKGDAEVGEFFNTLTSESYGDAMEFIVAYYQPGRAASHKASGRYYVAIGTDLIPESWSDLVGEAFVGTRFDEHPDAEEVYKRDVNNGVKEWGSGPLISTTYNYTGLAITPGLEGEEEEEPMPVRISFLRTTKAAHEKLMTLKKATLRNRPFWEVVFNFSTSEKTFGRHSSYIVNVKKGRAATPAEQALAFEIAQAVALGRVSDNSEAAEAVDQQVAPDANGGLAV